MTQEAVEGDCQMCMGVWNGHYGKLPLSVLKRLPQAEVGVYTVALCVISRYTVALCVMDIRGISMSAAFKVNWVSESVP